MFSRPGVDLEIVQLAGVGERLHGRLEGRDGAVIDLDVAHRGGVGEQDRAALGAARQDALDHGLAADRRGRGVLTGVADAVAVLQARVVAVEGRNRNPELLGLGDHVVVGAGLAGGDRDAVDGRVLEDLVDDLELARIVVDRRFRPELDQVDAEGVGRDLGADVGRVEEAVAGGVTDDREGQLAILAVKVGSVGAGLGGVRERRAADRLVDPAGNLGLDRTAHGQRQADRGGAERYRGAMHVLLSLSL